MPLRLGTRGSKLALWQAEWVAAELKKHGIDTEITIIKTSGDTVQHTAIENIGAQGVFTREIQKALLNGNVDFAVHSLKDLPTDSVDGLELVAVPRRGNYRDAFLCHSAETLDALPVGAKIGTGSLRRRTQIIHRFGQRFQLTDVRGNVETRLRKLDEGQYDALILAEAGLERLGFAEKIRSLLALPEFLPAVGQGALGIEIASKQRDSVGKQLECLTDANTFLAVKAERAFLQTLKGGCIAPIAAFASVDDETLTLHGRILSLDGQTMFEDTAMQSTSAEAEILGIGLANGLLQTEAKKIVEQIQGLRTPETS